MARTVSARRYAQAIYDIALEGNDVEKWLDDLSVLSESASDATFVSFADSPQVASEMKTAVVKEAFGKRAEIVSAVPLSKSQVESITKDLSSLVGKEISVTTRTDGSIIGGFVARVGDRLIDGSVKTRLDDMKRELIRGA